MLKIEKHIIEPEREGTMAVCYTSFIITFSYSLSLTTLGTVVNFDWLVYLYINLSAIVLSL